MKHKRKELSILLLAVAFLLNACGTVPITGRKQLSLVSENDILTSSLQQYSQYISKAEISSNIEKTAMVRRVGKRIAAATEQYLSANGYHNELKNFSWEFNLVNDNQLNAFCMPGGKIVVYEGLLKIAGTDDELAVVIGHEVAHAIAKHGNERMSQNLAKTAGSSLLNILISDKSPEEQNIWKTVYGMGSNVGVMLPFSRKHELEADYIGLILMRLAGYEPDVAVGFWEKMSKGGAKSVELLSTHPSDDTRVNKILEALPSIMQKYKPISGLTYHGDKSTKSMRTLKL